MKVCPFIDIQCKGIECELFSSDGETCSFTRIAHSLSEIRDALCSLEKEREFPVLHEISEKLEALAATFRDSEESRDSLNKTMTQISAAMDGIERALKSIQEDIPEKYLSPLLAVIEKVEDGYSEMERSYTEMKEYLSELKRSADQSSAKRRLEEAQEHNDRGVALFYAGSQDAARVEFEKTIELDPDMAEAYNNLALALTELGDHEEAVANFQKAYSLNPDLLEAYSNLGLVHFRRGDMEEGIRLLEEATKCSRRDSLANLNFGNGLFRLGRYDEAVRAWERAVEIDPENHEAREKLDLYKEGKLDDGLGGEDTA